MKRRLHRLCHAALLWPVIAQAAPVDIPELGVRLPDLPPGATAPKVVDKLIGYLASFQVGNTYVGILRLLDPVPAGASVADRRYRSSIREYLVDDIVPARHEGPTSIAGQSAWSVCGAEARSDSAVSWHCDYYLISDQHLYRLSVRAFSPQKPPEFDAVVRALYEMSFEPIRLAVGADGQPAALPKEPLFKWRQGQLSQDWYPARARSHGEEGVVDVEYGIDGQGRAQDLRVSYATSVDLTIRVEDFMRLLVFRVPSGWEASESRTLRFTLESQFSLLPCHFPAAARVAHAEQVTICASRLR